MSSLPAQAQRRPRRRGTAWGNPAGPQKIKAIREQRRLDMHMPIVRDNRLDHIVDIHARTLLRVDSMAAKAQDLPDRGRLLCLMLMLVDLVHSFR